MEPSHPSASMSNAPREASPNSRSRSCEGQAGARWGIGLVALLLVGELSAARRAVRGHDELALGAVAQVDDRAEDLGDDMPASRSTTVSPMSTPLRLTSWALWRVAIDTVDPATVTGSMTPNGVTRPVRPTLTWMSSRVVLTSSGGYLNAIAQRGAREVLPRRRCTVISSTLTTTPSISCSTLCRRSP